MVGGDDEGGVDVGGLDGWVDDGLLGDVLPGVEGVIVSVPDGVAPGVLEADVPRPGEWCLPGPLLAVPHLGCTP